MTPGSRPREGRILRACQLEPPYSRPSLKEVLGPASILTFLMNTPNPMLSNHSQLPEIPKVLLEHVRGKLDKIGLLQQFQGQAKAGPVSLPRQWSQRTQPKQSLACISFLQEQKVRVATHLFGHKTEKLENYL